MVSAHVRRIEFGKPVPDALVRVIVETSHERIAPRRIGGEVRINASDVLAFYVLTKMILLYDEWRGTHIRFMYVCFFPHTHE